MSQLIPLSPTTPDPDVLKAAAARLRDGALVAFPTETVYGLGADACNPAAVQRIYAMKGRPADNPLIVHLADPEAITDWCNTLPAAAHTLIAAFWPGPLSIVLPKPASIPPETTAHLDTMVLRCPSHPVARALIRAAGTPLAAPSANRSGHVSPTTAAHVLADFAHEDLLILDAGATTAGLESTVLDLTTEPFTLLRPGSITKEMLTAVVGEIVTPNTAECTAARSPGMKYRHYSPRAPITLFTGSSEATRAELLARLAAHPNPEHIVVITHAPLPEAPHNLVLGDTPEAAAPQLYAALRAADQPETQEMWIQGYEKCGVGAVVMNRLEKAATKIIQ